MKNILFVFRGIGPSNANPVVIQQYNSISDQGVRIDLFPLKTAGAWSYVHELFRLRRFIKKNSYDIIHAHYSYSGFISGIQNSSRVICSLMGSDVYSQPWLIKLITKFYCRFVWSAVVVKSENMNTFFKSAHLIPNGINTENFSPIPSEQAFSKSNFNPKKINILFIALDPNSTVKNLPLAKKSIELLNNEKVNMVLISDKRAEEMSYYYNSADLLLLTSRSEGSPNVIKEAMACNCPIVSTDVGDAAWVIGKTKGCYICKSDPEDISDKLQLAIDFAKNSGRTNGRKRIIELGLDEKSIAKKIIDLYYSVSSHTKSS